jgi:hypothetical protein
MEGWLAALLWLLPAAAQAQAIQAWVQLSDPSYDWLPRVFLALDASGNVVVSGQYRDGSQQPTDWLTMKYSSAGVPLWTNRYNAPDNADDYSSAIEVDATGNVVVTGGSWGSSGADSVTIKYSSTGEALWTNRYDGPAHGTDFAYAIAVDTNGNVYVTGQSANGANYGISTIKYSSAGVPLWTNYYNGSGDSNDAGRGVMVDAGGNVSVFGTVSGAFRRITYSSAGALLQVKTYASVAGNYSYAHDHSGNLILAAQYPNNTLRTVKYSSAGALLWANVSPFYFNRPAVRLIAVDADDNVYAAGMSSDASSDGRVTIKYSSAGVPLWTNRYNGPGNRYDQPTALALDSSGNVFVTGDTYYNSTNYAIATLGYSSSGIPLFTNLYIGPGKKRALGWSLAVDASGNVYVAGDSETSDSSGADTRFVFATLKYVIPPIITRQPLSCTNAIGTTANFAVEAVGAAGTLLNYQWRRAGTNLVDGGNISGVTTTNLLIANVQLADAAGYSVVVTNDYGSTTSSVAQLTVISLGRFSNYSYSPVMGLSFLFRDGTVGQSYRIQTSTALAAGSWVDWQSFTYTGPVGFLDFNATGAERRFYRAVSP